MKNLQYILCRNREDCANASTERKKSAKTENVQLIVFYIEDCMIASRNILMLFNEHAAASKKILKKNVQLFLKSIKKEKNVLL